MQDQGTDRCPCHEHALCGSWPTVFTGTALGPSRTHPLPKALLPDIVTLRGRISTYEFGGGGHKQADHNTHHLFLTFVATFFQDSRGLCLLLHTCVNSSQPHDYISGEENLKWKKWALLEGKKSMLRHLVLLFIVFRETRHGRCFVKLVLVLITSWLVLCASPVNKTLLTFR